VTSAPRTLLVGAFATFAAFTSLGCGGSSAPPQAPAAAQPAAATAQDPDPTMGTADLNSASNSSTAPPGAPASLADPAGHAPIVSVGSGNGDTPINSGAGDAAPEHTH
jgi:hypothetical protein